MEVVSFPHFPTEFNTLHIALFTNVTNAKELKKRIVAASTLPGEEGDVEREAVNFAFIDASLVTSRAHLITAVQQAILVAAQGNLRTKTIHSEILWVLNPTNNISEAIRRYGVGENTTSLLIARVCSNDNTSTSINTIQDQIRSLVQGELTPLDQLQTLTDWNTVKKYHKLNSDPAILATISKKDLKDANDANGAAEHAVIDNIVTSSIAIKSVMV